MPNLEIKEKTWMKLVVLQQKKYYDPKKCICEMYLKANTKNKKVKTKPTKPVWEIAVW